jgi:hypothetical protein
LVQQHYKSEDYAKIVNEEHFDPTTYKIPETGDENNDGVPDEDNQNDQAQEEETPQEDQIDSTLKPPDEQGDAPEQESVRENEENDEIHEEYEHSDEESMEQSPYDPNDIWELDVNIKSKVKTLKKLILEKINLEKAANIILLKKVPSENQSQVQQADKEKWTEFTE